MKRTSEDRNSGLLRDGNDRPVRAGLDALAQAPGPRRIGGRLALIGLPKVPSGWEARDLT